MDMDEDSLFDGWLSVPASIGAFLDHEPQKNVDPPMPNPQQNVSMNLALNEDELHPQNSASDMLPYRSPSRDPSLSRSSQTPGNASVANANARKRRPHTKSRLGCTNCRKKKIKCQETWPACANCIKRGILCSYPNVYATRQSQLALEISRPQRLIQLDESPTLFTSNDMRLFHHFLIAAHPEIPYQRDTIWIQDVPMLGHQFNYLMHAILGLAGSHLAIYADDPASNGALNHRQKAIVGLEDAFSRWPPSAEEAHVMLATSFLLAFQSGYHNDGFVDHLLSIRGCTLLSRLIQEQDLKGVFSVEPSNPSVALELNFFNFPELNQLLAEDALASLASFAHHVNDSSCPAIERALYQTLVESVAPLIDYPGNQVEPSTSLATTSPESDPDQTEASTPESPYHLSLSKPSIKDPVFPGDIDVCYNQALHANTTSISDAGQGAIRAFNAVLASFTIMISWPQEAVLEVFSPTNMLGHVIIAHFVCIRFALTPLSPPETSMKYPIKAMIEWCEKFVAEVDDADALLEGDEKGKWTKYLAWPKSILKTMRSCVDQKRGLVFADLYKILVEDPESFREGRVVV